MEITENIFIDEPKKWGLRGDPFLWLELKDKLDGESFESLYDFKKTLTNEFKLIIQQGTLNDTREIVRMGNKYPRNGMSGGLVSLDWWKEEGLPYLFNKFEELILKDYSPEGDITIQYSEGGMREFARTGKYPKRLQFYSSLFNKNWNHKVTEDTKTGKVKSRGKTLFSYNFSLNNNEIELIDKDGTKSQFIYQHVMCD